MFDFRPKNLDEILAQDELVELFKKFISCKKLPHCIFHGNSATGKTSFARIIAKEFGLDFYEFNGANFKLEELRKILDNYKNSLYKPLIFIDEIHRLNKTQQDTLLAPLENNECIFISASTQEPYFAIVSSLRSRCLTFYFKNLQDTHKLKLILKIQSTLNFKLEEKAKDFLIKQSDIRVMLNLINFGLVLNKENLTLENLLKLKNDAFSQNAEQKHNHYELTSALIKSIRGSDTDAGIYYLARLIKSACDPLYIARRLVILASEDISNADPYALILATSCLEAVKNIGYPEAKIILAQCVVYLSCAIKSNSSYKAINAALAYLENNQALEIPEFLYKQKKDYLYPHDFGGYVKQEYLSKKLKFYENKQKGYEKKLFENLTKIKESSLL